MTLGIVSNNDSTIKSINLETAQVEKSMSLPFAVNVCMVLKKESLLLLIPCYVFSALHFHQTVVCFV